MGKGYFDIVASVVLAKALPGHIRSLLEVGLEKDLCHNHQELMVVQAKVLYGSLQVLMAGLVKVLCRSHQAPRVVQETVVDRIRRVLKVALAIDDDHDLVLKDSSRSLQVLDRHTVLVDLAVGNHYHSRTLGAVALALFPTLQPSCLHLHLRLLPLAPTVCLPCHSRPFLYLDPVHKVRLLARLYHIPLAGQNLLFPCLEILESSSSHQNIDFATLEVLTDLFSYQPGASNRRHSMLVMDSHTHLWVRCIHRARPVYHPVLLFLVRHIY